jgi:hypothetical protein
MRRILQLVAAASALACLSLAPIEAIGQSSSSEGAGKTRRQLEERPFGGPPPKYRSPKHSKKCKSAKKTCELKKEDLVGNKCICPGPETAQGTIVE